jgi:hypothetical protein
MIQPFLLPINKLDDLEKEAVFRLFQTHFEGVTWQQFIDDLKAKNWIILLNQDGILKGFSTLLFYYADYQGKKVKIVYSGDTVTDPSMWSSPALAQAWTSAIQAIQGDSPEKLYWLLISSGYRTYRFLSVFAKEFFPRYDQVTPSHIAAFMEQLAIAQFQECYDPETGIVHFPNPQILSPELRLVPPEKLKDPHVSFFVTKNPNHDQGDELVCLAEVTESNVTRAGMRIWKTGAPLEIPFPIETLIHSS